MAAEWRILLDLLNITMYELDKLWLIKLRKKRPLT